MAEASEGADEEIPCPCSNDRALVSWQSDKAW